MKHNALGAALALVIGVLSACPAFATTAFPDMGKYRYYDGAVDYVSEFGIIRGDENGNFGPEKNVTRAEMATILCRLMGQTEHLQSSDIFSDVPMDHWASTYITKAAELGIVKGYGDGRFGPQDPVTSEQALTMVIRAAGREDEATGGYPNGFLDLAKRSGLMHDVQVEMGEFASRLDVAVILYNCLGNRFYFPGTGHTLASCDFNRTHYTDDPNHRTYGDSYDTKDYSGDADARLVDAHLILIRAGDIYKNSAGILYYPHSGYFYKGEYFDVDPKYDEFTKTSGKPIVGPYWRMIADNCPHGSVLVGVENDNGDPVHVLASDLNFQLDGKYSTLDFDIGPLYEQGNSYDDVRVYLDGEEAAHYRIAYDTAVRHDTLNVTGVKTITFRVEGDPDYDPDEIRLEANEIIICNTKLELAE